jgi:hypothetical protein
MSEALEVIDLGDAREETRQLEWIPRFWDNIVWRGWS